MLEELADRFASPPIRNSGTFCGNVANGSPIGEMQLSLGHEHACGLSPLSKHVTNVVGISRLAQPDFAKGSADVHLEIPQPLDLCRRHKFQWTEPHRFGVLVRVRFLEAILDHAAARYLRLRVEALELAEDVGGGPRNRMSRRFAMSKSMRSRSMFAARPACPWRRFIATRKFCGS
jgi:hypothetical protein